MDWDDRLRFNATMPPKSGLQRMARVIAGSRAQVVAVRRLKGGVDASTHAVRLDPGGWIVLKRSCETSVTSLHEEFRRLEFAQRVPVATPSPIAVDVEGAWFGRPALVMSFIRGSSVLHREPGRWVFDLGDALAAIHDVRLPADLPEVLLAPHAGIVWRPAESTRLRRTARVERLVEVALQLQHQLRGHSEAPVLLHHDFHHGNVAWRAGRLAGVLDWNEARVGPSACDVAYCSVDLAMTHGAKVAEQFTAAYRTASGRSLENLAMWQALWIANDMRWVGYWVAGLKEAGADHLTLPVLRRRLRSFADRVLAAV